jgi:calcineurin-like phosphoesterase family protein
MSRVPTFFTSDWHIGHANSLKFDNRPFKDLREMHSSLIKRYNSAVPESGICYFLGDVGLCGGDVIRDVITKLNGTKVLILGNHDKKMNAMYGYGFNVVLNSASLVISNELVTMTHCPLIGIPRENTSSMKGCTGIENWHGEGRHPHFSIENNGQFHLHGHIHSPNGGKSQKIAGRQYDVGVVANNYTPVSISQIESWIVKTKLSVQTSIQ